MRKRLLVLVLLMCLLFSACASAPAAETTVSLRDQTSGSELYTLSVNSDTCNVSVLDRDGNTVLSTNPENPQEDAYTPAATLNNLQSQLIVSYYDELNVDATVGSYLSSVKKGTFTITQNSSAFVRIDYDFSRKDEQFIIPVEYRLENDCLQVRVLTDEIKEYGVKRINRISLTPYLVRGSAEDSGYLLLPDGSGATVDFNYVNCDAAAYSAQIYGQNNAEAMYYREGNPESVLLPAFGADYGNYGVLALVDGNAAAGWINARATGSACSYAYAYASFDYRVFDTVTISGSDWQKKEYVANADMTETEDFSVSYYILSQGGLQAMADMCRNALAALPQAPDKALNAVLYAYGVTTQRAAFLGIPYTKNVVATDFEDVSDMLNTLDAENRSFAVLLRDFDRASVEEDYPGKVKWLSDCGGSNGFEKLKNGFSGTSFYCVANTLYEPATGLLWTKQFHFAKMVSRENLRRYTYSPVTYAYEATDYYGQSLSHLNKQMTSAFAKAQYPLALSYLGSELYCDYSASEGTSRSAYRKTIARLLSENAGNCAIDGGNAYAMGMGSMNYNIPVSSSAYDLETGSVPFLQMVYHGNAMMVSAALNMASDAERELLNCIASGTVPCFAVTEAANEDLRRSGYKNLFGTEFETQSQLVSDILTRTEDYYNAIYNCRITDYTCENGVSVTTYENGIRAIVNYTEDTVYVDGNQINSMDFSIIR